MTTPAKNRIDKLREAGWTDRAIASALGVTRATVWSWRTGRHHPLPSVTRHLNDLVSLNQLAQELDTVEAEVDTAKLSPDAWLTQPLHPVGPDNGTAGSDRDFNQWLVQPLG